MATRSPQLRSATTAGGFPLVLAAAVMWGTDALFRRGLALELPATTVVVWEHLLLATAMAPLLYRVPWRRLTRADVVSLVLIGAGASALATILFTASFRYADPNTPLLLQKLQPLVAIVGARILLRERMAPRFGVSLLIALTAAWLITFPDPLQVRAQTAAAGALAAGAAALWGMGTVLGRRMSTTLSPHELTAARFAVGLPAAVVFAAVEGGGTLDVGIAAGDLLPLVLLSLIPGLLAMLLYYRGLRRTPASAATVAELGFPVAALSINAVAFGATLTATQALGTVVLTGVLLTLSLRSRRSDPALGIRHGAPVPAGT